MQEYTTTPRRRGHARGKGFFAAAWVSTRVFRARESHARRLSRAGRGGIVTACFRQAPDPVTGSTYLFDMQVSDLSTLPPPGDGSPAARTLRRQPPPDRRDAALTATLRTKGSDAIRLGSPDATAITTACRCPRYGTWSSFTRRHETIRTFTAALQSLIPRQNAGELGDQARRVEVLDEGCREPGGRCRRSISCDGRGRGRSAERDGRGPLRCRSGWRSRDSCSPRRQPFARRWRGHRRPEMCSTRCDCAGRWRMPSSSGCRTREDLLIARLPKRCS